MTQSTPTNSASPNPAPVLETTAAVIEPGKPSTPEAPTATLTEPVKVTQPAAPPVQVQAPAPVKVAPPAVPEGRPFECDPSAASPGEIVQVVAQFPAGTVLKGLVLGEGLAARTVLVGRFRYPANEADSWESCLGKPVPDMAFVILLAENITQETVIARATWYVVDGSAAAAPHPMSSPAVAPPAMAPSLFAGKHATVAVAPPAPPRPVGPKAVTPGTNEVAILLQRTECERLLNALTGGDPVEHQYQPSIIRQLHAALAR